MRFRHKHNLKQHVKIHNRVLTNNSSSQQCRYCLYRSDSQFLVRKHELTHEVEMVVEEEYEDDEREMEEEEEESVNLGKQCCEALPF